MDDACHEHPQLSIVIRCRNEAAALGRLFLALEAQRWHGRTEIIVVDNESDDESVAVARGHGARVVSISRQDFSYGRAINLGVAQARGALVMLLSAHALPIGSAFIAAACAPFAESQVAAIRCLLVTSAGQLANWYAPRDLHDDQRYRTEPHGLWISDYPTAGCCVIRRSVWETVKYDETLESNEDKLWALNVLSQGYAIRCCAEAIWMYTRTYGRRERIMRESRQRLALYRITGRAPLSTLRFAWLSFRTLAVAPLVAGRYVLENLSWNWRLWLIPWKARRQPQVGSYPEFERRD